MNCTGCGQCCLSEKCGAALIAFGDKDEICPALHFVREGYYRCLLIELENVSGLSPLIRKALAIGMGCTNEDRAPLDSYGQEGD